MIRLTATISDRPVLAGVAAGVAPFLLALVAIAALSVGL